MAVLALPVVQTDAKAHVVSKVTQWQAWDYHAEGIILCNSLLGPRCSGVHIEYTQLN